MNNPCEWCNDTSKRIDSLEAELEETKAIIIAKDKTITKLQGESNEIH